MSSFPVPFSPVIKDIDIWFWLLFGLDLITGSQALNANDKSFILVNDLAF